MGVFCSFIGSDIFLFHAIQWFRGTTKISASSLCFFVVAGEEKFCHVFSLIGDFSCGNISLWNSSPSDETPVCWLKSLKGEGWKGHQTVVFSAGCRIQVVRGQTLVASIFTKYITYLVWNFFGGVASIKAVLYGIRHSKEWSRTL